MKDLITEGLRLVLGHSSGKPRRMNKAPVRIREGNRIRGITNDAMAKLLERGGERLP